MTKTARMTIEISLPLRTVSETNTREHWRVRASRAKSQRSICKAACFGHGLDGVANASKKLRVTMTRVGPRRLDDDNLASSLKHIREKGATTPVPEELRPDLIEIRDRYLYARRQGIEVRLSKYMLSLLRLEEHT